MKIERDLLTRVERDFQSESPWIARNSPWMANLTAALESKANIALIVGEIDNVPTIRGQLGCLALDGVLPHIEKMFRERFGNYSVRMDVVFLIFVTGPEAGKAAEIAESLRAAVEAVGTTLDERFNVTMSFGVTQASSDWAAMRLYWKPDVFSQLIAAVDSAIEYGISGIIANRVYEPMGLDTFWKTIAKPPTLS